MTATNHPFRERLKTLLLLMMGISLVMSWSQTQSHAEAPKVTAECVTVLSGAPKAKMKKAYQGRIVGEEEGGLVHGIEKWMQAQQTLGKGSFTMIQTTVTGIAIICAY